MGWSGEVDFGPHWVTFRGQAQDNSPHPHAALQVAWGAGTPVRITSADGITHSGGTTLALIALIAM